MYLNLDSDQLVLIRELAGLLTSVTDMAALMDIDEDMLRMELMAPDSEAGRIYRKAVAETALEIRRQELQFARMGSPAAVQSAAAYLASMDLNL